MSELTREYLDKQLNNQTKELKSYVDGRINVQTEEINSYVDDKVGEVEVLHRQRRHGKTKYGWGRGIKGILDLLTIIFLTGFIRRPGHFFGTLGIGSFSLGFLIGIYITYLRITTGSTQARHPLLFFGMLLMIIGVQLISTGLIAEMVASYYHRTKS